MGKVCTFFGHHDCPNTIMPKLKEVVVDLIEHHNVDTFYVGRQGMFDSIVRFVLRELTQLYPHIKYSVVLERVPEKKNEFDLNDYSDTMLPEGIENVHPRYAISWRNRWMIKQSEYVVAYVIRPWGGAASFMNMAVRQKKVIINIGLQDVHRQ